MADDRVGRGRANVPPLLSTVADYSWRLIVVGVVAYGLVTMMGRLHVVLLPVAVALLLCALLNPITDRLRKAGLPSLAATWLTMLLALGVLGGIGTWVGIRANDETPRLLNEVQNTSKQVQHWLVNGPLHLKNNQLQSWTNSATNYLEHRRGELAGTAVQAGTVVAEVAAGIVFLFFVTFFLLKDGALIWKWLISGTGRYHTRVDRAGRAAWQTLSQYIHGTVMVAAIHAIVIAIALWILGVPLLAPLAVLVFFGSFIPIVGILVAGGVAVLVTFGTRGWVAGLIFLAVLIIEQQLEGHVLQPFVVGRWVRLHPLAVIMAITVGGVVGGITGAAFAVPTTAVLFRAWPALRGTDAQTPAEDADAPPPNEVSNDSDPPSGSDGGSVPHGGAPGDPVPDGDQPDGDPVPDGSGPDAGVAPDSAPDGDESDGNPVPHGVIPDTAVPSDAEPGGDPVADGPVPRGPVTDTAAVGDPVPDGDEPGGDAVTDGPVPDSRGRGV